MLELHGRGVSSGIAIGHLVYYSNASDNVKKYYIDDTDAEIERYRNGVELAKEYLQSLYDEACNHVSASESSIFQMHILVLEDSKFVQGTEEYIRNQKVNAEYAVRHTAEKLASVFKELDDEYLKSRYTDILDAGNTLIKILQRKKNNAKTNSESPVIIAAKELMPSETVSLKKNSLLGFITNLGSQNSHTAILARTMGLPSVTQVKIDLSEYDGKTAIIDGQLGRVYIEPDKKIMAKYIAKKKRFVEEQNRLKRQIGKPSVTKNGQKIILSANIGTLDDIETAEANDADGVGLFRSEYMFLNRKFSPGEEEQYEVYKRVIKKYKKSGIVIRTADLSADKGIDYLDMPNETNPSLGFRGIRVCLENRDFFKTQLRALYRASIYGKLKILLTMVNNTNEIDYVKRVIEEVKIELHSEGYSYNNNVKLGVMIETPAAAIISDEICKEVDFISIGTNNLTQFTLALDRKNQKLEFLYEPHHKSVLRLIKYISDNAHKNHIPVSVCGELASDKTLTPFFLALKIDELSMSPSKILEVRAKVRETDTNKTPEILKKLDH